MNRLANFNECEAVKVYRKAKATDMNNVKGSKENEEDYKIDFDRIAELIEKYKSEKTQDKIKGYTEEQTKVVFITPFFKALGWNTENRQNHNDSVSYEENIAGKRSDYGFSINGITKFYLEAKSLKEEGIVFGTGYDKQAVNYAWLKSCSWAVLTNFETLAVYNADSGKSEWTFTLKSEEYLGENGRDKLKLLSKRGFEKGLLDTWALVNGKKLMKRPVDEQLLLDMIHFRETLSKDIKKNNPHVSEDDIDETVQRILDRLVFIRNAEDRGYESKNLKSYYNQFSQKEKGQLIKKVRELYQHYRDVYNSGLFGKDTKTIHISDQVDISNEALSEVIQGLYSPEGAIYSYNFAVLDADVLGKIYEQYLGNILKQTPKRAKLEESKTHRKEQGIYYTPSYIVNYIVKNTVGEYIKTHTPEEIRKVRILDPACGSGSFLIRAYKELEEYWNKYYEKNKDISESVRTVKQTKFNPDMEGKEIEFYSTKTEILKNNIFGVDLDPKAVEIAQLNLLLQISERKHRLPILQNNIKVGNSLIDDPSISDRAFKWEEEFPEIMKEGEFDIVIGNPPYVRIQNLGDKEVDYFSNNFQSAFKNYDIYLLFVEKSLKLLRENGDIGFIIPSKFVNSDYGLGLRNVIAESKTLHKLVDFKDIQIFGDATNYTCLLFLKNKENKEFEYMEPKSIDEFSLSEISNPDIFQKYRLLIPKENESWILSNNKVNSLMKKLKGKGESLGEISKNIFVGLQTSADPIYFIEVISDAKETVKIRNIKDHLEFVVEKAILKKLLKGKDIRKWNVDWKGFYVVYPYFVENGKASLIPLSEIKEKFPLAYRYFEHYESQLKSREYHRLENHDDWHQYIYRKNLEKFEQPKIITQVLASNNTFAIDLKGEYYFVGGGNAGGYGIVLNDSDQKVYYFVLALLNSNVLEFYLKNISTPFRGGYFSYGKRFIERLPIVLGNKLDIEKISKLSKEQVNLNVELLNSRISETNRSIKIKAIIESNDHILNEMIFQLYGMTNREKELVLQFLK
jgi:type I restriction-modification system DNA methylase subunit